MVTITGEGQIYDTASDVGSHPQTLSDVVAGKKNSKGCGQRPWRNPGLNSS